MIKKIMILFVIVFMFGCVNDDQTTEITDDSDNLSYNKFISNDSVTTPDSQQPDSSGQDDNTTKPITSIQNYSLLTFKPTEFFIYETKENENLTLENEEIDSEQDFEQQDNVFIPTKQPISQSRKSNKYAAIYAYEYPITFVSVKGQDVIPWSIKVTESFFIAKCSLPDKRCPYLKDILGPGISEQDFECFTFHPQTNSCGVAFYPGTYYIIINSNYVGEVLVEY